jgi:hypothetical protein
MVRPTLLNFSQALVFPPENILYKNFVEGRYDRTSRFGRITKISKTAFLYLVYLLNAMMNTNLESKHD